MAVVNMKREGDQYKPYADDTVTVEKPTYKAEFGLSQDVTSLIPTTTTWAALAVGIATGLLIGFYIARK